MGPSDRLGTLQMTASESGLSMRNMCMGDLQVGVSWHDVVRLLVRALDNHTDEIFQPGLDVVDIVKEPDTHVGSHLIIPRPASMELAAEWADQLTEPTLIGSVDVLVIGLDFKLRSENLSQCYNDKETTYGTVFPFQVD
jgi:hypothetical protein